MKLTKFFKTIVISFCLVASFALAGLTGCGNDSKNSADKREISDAWGKIELYLSSVKDGRNYATIVDRSNSNMFSFTYYGDGDKFQIDYNDTVIYGVVENYQIYKISQADDLSWHKRKSTDVDDMRAPQAQIQSLITKLNYCAWNEYNSKTKTLKYVTTDGTITAKLSNNELTVEFIYTDGTEKTMKITVKDVGTTTVTLPENIIDDTPN